MVGGRSVESLDVRIKAWSIAISVCARREIGLSVGRSSRHQWQEKRPAVQAVKRGHIPAAASRESKEGAHPTC